MAKDKKTGNPAAGKICSAKPRVGEDVMMCVAPGTLIAGRVIVADGESYVLRPASWVETPGGPMTGLSAKVAETHHPIAGGVSVQNHGLLWHMYVCEEQVAASVVDALK